MGIVDELIDFFPDTIIGQRGTTSGMGAWAADGSDPVTYPARYEGGPRQVRVETGAVETSNTSAIVAGAPPFDAKDWRYTLPARFHPRENLRALWVDKADDESGPAYVEVFFP